MRARRQRAIVLAAVHACGAAAAAPAQNLAADPAAVKQLVAAVSLDVMSEASLRACEDVGAPSTSQMRAAWVAWRERHQIAPLRLVVADLRRRQGSSAPSWKKLTEPLRQRVLSDPAPDQACAGLARDWQAAGMDVSAQYPQARAVAVALVQAKLVSPPDLPAVAPGPARGQVLLPSQIDALSAQQGGGWSSISKDEAQRKLGPVHVKGRVERWSEDPDRYHLIQEHADRAAQAHVYLKFDAEPWVGREVVVRGLVTSLRAYAMDLADAAIVGDTSGLTPSPLPQQPLARKEVLLQRVMSAPGKGLPEKDLAAVVIHGEANYNQGTRWEEDVRFLMRDGSVYRRTEMPPDQLNAAASRQLEPQRWGRWRAGGKGYEMQPQDDDGRPGAWQPEKHRAVRPWPKDTRLEGSYSRGTFSGSLVTGGISSTRGIRFTRDGRFERSYSSLASSGSLAAVMNNTVVSGSSHGDGKGSSSTGGGTVGTPFGTAGAVSSRSNDDGASRRGRYQLSGFVLTLDYDDGHQERLLSFPVHDDNKTVYVGNGSMSLDK
ncbi:hypothetical protein J2X16_001376 [Pelomonas aquatica]|uniref:Uncharacterized protein n=1 Tax=Pelomonas aquatica TaxID=431058 RepID=A0ABU1Z600_9BURK|nr:hypothetical protein [Pelomonas aquatica]MDR7296037.1 hypothetical protein [Pelomonas aquatica]